MRINWLVIELFIVLFVILFIDSDCQTEWLWSIFHNPYVISLDPLTPALLTSAAIVKLRVAGAIASYAISKRKEWIAKESNNGTETSKNNDTSTTTPKSTAEGQKGPYPNPQNAMLISMDQIFITTQAPETVPSMEPPSKDMLPPTMDGGYRNEPQGTHQLKMENPGYPGTGYRMNDQMQSQLELLPPVYFPPTTERAPQPRDNNSLRSMSRPYNHGPSSRPNMNGPRQTASRPLPNSNDKGWNTRPSQNGMNSNLPGSNGIIGPSSPRPYMNSNGPNSQRQQQGMGLSAPRQNTLQEMNKQRKHRPVSRIELRSPLNIFSTGKNRWSSNNNPHHEHRRVFHEYHPTSTTQKSPSLIELAGQKMHFTIPRVEIRPSIELFSASSANSTGSQGYPRMDDLYSIVKNHTESWIPTMPSLSIPNPLNIFSSPGNNSTKNDINSAETNTTAPEYTRRMDDFAIPTDSWFPFKSITGFNPLSSIYSRVIGTTTTTTPRSVINIIPPPDLKTTTTTTTTTSTSTTTSKPKVEQKEDENQDSDEESIESSILESVQLPPSPSSPESVGHFYPHLSSRLLPPSPTGLRKSFHAALLDSKPFSVAPTMPEILRTTITERSTLPTITTTSSTTPRTTEAVIPEPSSNPFAASLFPQEMKPYSFPMINPYGFTGPGKSPFQQFPYPQMPYQQSQFPFQNPYGLAYPQFQNPYLSPYPGAGVSNPYLSLGLPELQSLMSLYSSTTTTPKTISHRVKESKSKSSSKSSHSKRKHHHEHDRHHHEKKSSSKRHEKKKHSKSRRTKRALK